ncbi:MAG TPA: hypothetical protein VL947_01705, partial [Cytophagales bacterium]|nr:hypothetical protein [Cytophagales bacterium]
MKNEEELYDFIDEYLKSKHTQDGIADPELLEEINHQMLLKDVVQMHRLADVSLTLKKIESRERIKNKLLKVGVLLVLCVISALGLYVWLTHAKEVSKTLPPKPTKTQPSPDVIVPSLSSDSYK